MGWDPTLVGYGLEHADNHILLVHVLISLPSLFVFV